MNGQSRGRPSHFKPGSALVAEPVGPGNLQPSRHAIGRMARGMHSATSLSVKLQALVSCVGTIDMGTDSVRKYNTGKHEAQASKLAKRRAGKQPDGSPYKKKQKSHQKLDAQPPIDTSEAESDNDFQKVSRRRALSCAASRLKVKQERADRTPAASRNQKKKRAAAQESDSGGAEGQREIAQKGGTKKTGACRTKKKASLRTASGSLDAPSTTPHSADAVLFTVSAAVYINVCQQRRMTKAEKTDLIKVIAGAEQCPAVKTIVQNALVERVMDFEALCTQLQRAQE